MKFHTTRVEILEGRIAPAQTYFISGAALEIHDNTNALITAPVDDTDAAMFAGANKALRLTDGDTVVYDLNGDGIKNAGDSTLIKMMKGNAIAFFNDLNANAKFDLSEFTGLALGDAVKATVTAVINGDVATVLKPDGSLPHGGGMFQLQQSAIDGLKITGRVTGSVLAGTGIKNFDVLAPAFARQSDLSVGEELVVGSVADGLNVQFDGATTNALDPFTATPGAAGGDIVKVHLANGTNSILAGDGAAIANGTGGHGGNIIGVTIDSTPGMGDLFMTAGKGGNVTAQGTGGEGGRVEGLKVKFQSTGSLTIYAGGGGKSADGAGGMGGGILKSTFMALREPGEFNLAGGRGGEGGNAGVGGDGGAIVGNKVTLSRQQNRIDVSAGDGGPGGMNGGDGGDGGALTDLTLLSGGIFDSGDVILEGGRGGDGHGTGGDGGTGGALKNLNAKITGAIAGHLRVYGGAGGTATDSGVGGDGGEANKLQVTIAGSAAFDHDQIYGGAGGNGNSGNGGRGGNLTAVTATNLGTLANGYVLASGPGGSVASGAGDGGDSGDVSKVSILNFGRLPYMSVYSESGGDAAAAGKGGNSGKISDVTILNLGQAGTAGGSALFVGGSGGGNGGMNSGDGGRSGDITNVKVTDVAGTLDFTQNIGYIYATPGGDAPSATGKGGDMGNVSKLTLNGLNSYFCVNYPPSSYFRAGQGGAGGGKGGDVTDVKGTAAILDVFAGIGGNATADGKGGDGGNVSKINFKTVTEYVHSIRAGNGGKGAGTGNGGNGGSVTDVKVPGDIGDFRTVFNTANPAPIARLGMGGLFAGAGGTGATAGVAGSITKVKAQRIAAILAGFPTGGTLTTANAVTSISAITALVIGADVDDDRVFDFNNDGGSPTTGFDLGSADEAIDGLVLVKNTAANLAALTGKVAPDFLFTV